MQADEKMAEYRTLDELLDEWEKLLLVQKAEMEEQVRKAKDEYLAILSEGLVFLMNLVQVREEK